MGWGIERRGRSECTYPSRLYVGVDSVRVDDNSDTIARGGGRSFRTWCSSGKSRLMIPPNLSPTELVVSKPASVTSGLFGVGRVQDGHAMRMLNTASASFLLAAATKRIRLDTMSH